MAQINFRVHDHLKEEAAEIFNELGLDLTTGIMGKSTIPLLTTYLSADAKPPMFRLSHCTAYATHTLHYCFLPEYPSPVWLVVLGMPA
ncbi:MAG: hypothetical protein ACFWTP_15275 [Enterococcus gilvus]|jgi:hypothetical protein